MDTGYKIALIDACFIISGSTYLLCKFGKTTEYVPHLHVYSVQFGETSMLFKPRDLHDYYRLGVYQAGDMNLVTLKHYVQNL